MDGTFTPDEALTSVGSFVESHRTVLGNYRLEERTLRARLQQDYAETYDDMRPENVAAAQAADARHRARTAQGPSAMQQRMELRRAQHDAATAQSRDEEAQRDQEMREASRIEPESSNSPGDPEVD